MGIPIQTTEYYDNSGGVDYKSAIPKVADNTSSDTRNIDYSADGSARTRFGSSILNVSGGIPAQMSGAPRTIGLFEFKQSNGTVVDIICAGTTIKHDLVAPANQVTGLSGSLPIPSLHSAITSSEEWVIWCNGSDTNRKYNSATPAWVNLSLPRPAAPTAIDNGVGALGAGNYYYYYSHCRLTGGVVVEEGELSPASAVLALGAFRQIQVGFAVSADTQVNARRIYRISPTSVGIAYLLTTINDNTTTTYNDNTVADGTVEAEYDNQAAPTSTIAATNDYGETFYIEAADQTKYHVSKPYKPSNVPTENEGILDSKITCVINIYGLLVFGTQTSIWYLQGSYDGNNVPIRVTNKLGILNKRCADGQDVLYIVGTNKKIYQIAATDLLQAQIKIDVPISFEIDSVIGSVAGNQDDKIFLKYFSNETDAKVYISVPLVTTDNDALLVYNEHQSIVKQKPIWQIFENLYANALATMTISNKNALVSGDANGFLWKYEDQNLYGDGDDENGTATASTGTTLTDGSKTWTVNAYTGMRVLITGGTGEGQSRVISSNTATQLTVSSAWTTNPSTDSTYSIGGYINYFFTNWKPITNSYEDLKQLQYIVANLNTTGSYSIKLILQFDGSDDETQQTEFTLSLASGSTIWGAFYWGTGVWGSRGVLSKIIRAFKRFKMVRVGFYSNVAGQPFLLNYFSMGSQNLGKWFKNSEL